MSDLISRSAVIDLLDELGDDEIFNGSGRGYDALSKARYKVEDMPIAYDKEAVVKQIEEMFGVDAEYYGTEVKWAVEKAREIVRKGCVKNE